MFFNSGHLTNDLMSTSFITPHRIYICLNLSTKCSIFSMISTFPKQLTILEKENTFHHVFFFINLIESYFCGIPSPFYHYI